MGDWNHRTYGTREDPVRQSDLNQLASSYGCPKSFRLRKEEEARGDAIERETARGATCIGNGTHEAFRRYLGNNETASRILEGEVPRYDAVLQVVQREVERAADGLPIDWGKDEPEKKLSEAASMVQGGLAEIGRRACEIVVVEGSFLTEIDCWGKSYWLTGTVDLAYRPKHDPEGLALCDWKSGQQRLPQTILDHGYQFGIYAHALEHGLFGPEEKCIGQFPTEIWLGHLRDFIPYQKVTEKVVDRPEEADFFGVELGTKIAVPPPSGFPEPKKKKDGTPYKERARKTPVTKVHGVTRRGPGFYQAHRKPEDVARLKHSIRKIVSMVRMGMMVEFIGEHCDRCPFKMQCLTDGFGVHGEEKRQVEDALKGVDLDGLDDDVAA